MKRQATTRAVTAVIVFIGGLFSPSAQFAQELPNNAFVTLGTKGGPTSDAQRAQPANALLVGDDVYLVDAGDGAAGQLAKIGVHMTRVDGLFLSHLHFDHTGGIFAVLGLRAQLGSREVFRVYGPPGTNTLINGFLAALQPGLDSSLGRTVPAWVANVEVTELVAGSVIEFDKFVVTTAENNHFRLPEGNEVEEPSVSLSFRFDFADRSIVYTGDTGPDDRVVALAKGADLLVSEVTDISATLARVRLQAPDRSEQSMADLEWHLRTHHVTPKQVGDMATAAGVGSVVLTHLAPAIRTEAHAARIISAVRSGFDGEVTLAEDLDRF